MKANILKVDMMPNYLSRTVLKRLLKDKRSLHLNMCIKSLEIDFI